MCVCETAGVRRSPGLEMLIKVNLGQSEVDGGRGMIDTFPRTTPPYPSLPPPPSSTSSVTQREESASRTQQQVALRVTQAHSWCCQTQKEGEKINTELS